MFQCGMAAQLKLVGYSIFLAASTTDIVKHKAGEGLLTNVVHVLWGNNHSWFHLAIEDEDNESEDAGDELGGLFHVSRPDKEAKQKANGLDCSKFLVEKIQDWDLEEVIQSDS